MTHQEVNAILMKRQQTHFPNWQVKEYGTNSDIVMVREFPSLYGEPVMVLILNDHLLHVLQHPKEPTRFINVSEWQDPKTNELLQGDESWTLLIDAYNEIHFKVSTQFKTIFDMETLEDLIEVLEELAAFKKEREKEKAFYEEFVQ